MTRSLAAALGLIAIAAMAAAAAGGSPVAASPSPQSSTSIPVFAYYNLVLDTGFWQRANDEPALGRYLSDDRAVLRRHVRWAKGAGIDGFLISWRGFEAGERAQGDDQPAPYDAKLTLLDEVALAEGFSLGINYQSLDNAGRPSPVPIVAADLAALTKRLAGDPVYGSFGRPLVVWAGTWAYTREEVAAVAKAVGDGLLLLASERDVAGYERIADLVDGNAYYWSSVDPWQTPGYAEKLRALGESVHAQGGLWIAPAAPGFDARLSGGSRAVPRAGGQTLRKELQAATASGPDAIGLISWNGFTTDTHVEPSCRDGAHFLAVLSELLGGEPPSDVPPCSADATPSAAQVKSTPPAAPTPLPGSPTPALGRRGTDSGLQSVAVTLGAFAIVLIVCVGVLLRRGPSTERSH